MKRKPVSGKGRPDGLLTIARAARLASVIRAAATQLEALGGLATTRFQRGQGLRLTAPERRTLQATLRLVREAGVEAERIGKRFPV